MSERSQRLLELADDELISITTPGNARSLAVMRRLGMTYRGATHWHGYDVVWHAIDRAVDSGPARSF